MPVIDLIQRRPAGLLHLIVILRIFQFHNNACIRIFRFYDNIRKSLSCLDIRFYKPFCISR